MEKDLESWAREEISKHTGLMLKFVSPGRRGVPDDIVLWTEGLVHFVEFKIDEEQPDPMQRIFHRLMQFFGHTVFVFRTQEEVRDYIARYAP